MKLNKTYLVTRDCENGCIQINGRLNNKPIILVSLFISVNESLIINMFCYQSTELHLKRGLFKDLQVYL